MSGVKALVLYGVMMAPVLAVAQDEGAPAVTPIINTETLIPLGAFASAAVIVFWAGWHVRKLVDELNSFKHRLEALENAKDE